MGVPPAPAVFPRQLQSADGGAALACFLSGHFLPRWDWGYLEGQDPIPGGAEEAAASPFPTQGNASHPFHPTPGQLPLVRLRVGGGAAHGKASLGNVVVWIILRPDPHPAPPAPAEKVLPLPKRSILLTEVSDTHHKVSLKPSYRLPKKMWTPQWAGEEEEGRQVADPEDLKLSSDLKPQRKVMTPRTPSYPSPSFSPPPSRGPFKPSAGRSSVAARRRVCVSTASLPEVQGTA